MYKTVAYLRVSTEAQTDGSGLEQQRQSIMAYAAVTGLVIDGWVTDDESGTTEDREGIQQLLTQDGLTTLVFDRVDRLGRTLLVSESLFGKFASRGVRMLCVAQQLDDTPSGRMIRQMMGVVAEYQRAEWLKRMQTCKQATVASKGTFKGGQLPIGYRTLSSGQLAIDAVGARVVLMVFRLRASGHTLTSIAHSLALEGMFTKNGKPYAPAQVAAILKREAIYRAQAVFGSTQSGVAPVHPAILTEETQFMHVQGLKPDSTCRPI